MKAGQGFQAVFGCRSAACGQARSTCSATGRMPVLLCLMAALGWLLAIQAVEPTATTRFQAVHVFLDTNAEPLAAYQVYIHATNGVVKIVGIKGGEPAAFKQPPFYDPKAIQHERVILAAFSTKPKVELPTGKVRVATLHLQVTGDVEPQFETKLQAAANHDGKKLSPTISIEPVKP